LILPVLLRGAKPLLRIPFGKLFVSQTLPLFKNKFLSPTKNVCFCINESKGASLAGFGAESHDLDLVLDLK